MDAVKKSANMCIIEEIFAVIIGVFLYTFFRVIFSKHIFIISEFMAASKELTIKYGQLLKNVEDHQPLYKNLI
jgi:hypothetical protein